MPDSYNPYAKWDHFDFSPRNQPVPQVGICDEPCVCMRINQSWLPFILGAIDRLGQPDVWNDTEVNKQFAFDQINELEAALMACDCGSGSTTFTTTNKTNVALSATEINEAQVGSLANIGTYDPADPTLIAGGEVAYSTTSSRNAYDNGLCAALEIILRNFRQFWIDSTTIAAQEEKEKWDVASAIANGIGDAFLVVGTVYKPAQIYGWVSKFIGAMFDVLGQAIEAGVSFTGPVDLGQEWQDDFHCYLYQSLVDSDITFNKWRTVTTDYVTIDNYFLDADPQHGDLALTAWLHAVNDLLFYYSFMETLGTTVNATTSLGADFPCDCCLLEDASLFSLEFFDPNTVPVSWPYSNPLSDPRNFFIADSGAWFVPLKAFWLRFDEPIKIQAIRIHCVTTVGQSTHTVNIDDNCYSTNHNYSSFLAGQGETVEQTATGPGMSFGKFRCNGVQVSLTTFQSFKITGVSLRYQLPPF